MAEHRLARLKHIFRVRFNGSAPPTFHPEGILDIAAMTETGHLANGHHTPDGSSTITITADAFPNDDNTRLFLRFSHNGGGGSFFGELTFDQNGEQVVVGTFSPLSVQDKDSDADQIQEQWVITKP